MSDPIREIPADIDGIIRPKNAADLDGDGDRDVLSASKSDRKIAWYENTDGRGAFGPQQAMTNSVLRARDARSVTAADLDGDGDQDVLSASFIDDKIAWYENLDGLRAFGAQRVINIPDPDSDNLNATNGDADGPTSVYAADLDGDGDFDVLSASERDDRIAWYENLTPQSNAVRDSQWRSYE